MKKEILIAFTLSLLLSSNLVYAGWFNELWEDWDWEEWFRVMLSVSQYPNMYEGQVVSYEHCPNYPSYCEVMKSPPDRDTGKAHSVSEGTITADRPISAAFIKIYDRLEAKFSDCELGGSGYSHLIIYVWNFNTNSWHKIVDEEVNPPWDVTHNLDIGDIMPRRGTPVENYGECHSFEYREYMRKACTVRTFNLDSKFIDPSDEKTIKFKLDMYAQGRNCNDGETTYGGILEINSIWAEFTYRTCPVCPLPTIWSGCEKGETEEFRTNYKCLAETNYKCVEYKEYRSCPAITTTTTLVTTTTIINGGIIPPKINWTLIGTVILIIIIIIVIIYYLVIKK